MRSSKVPLGSSMRACSSPGHGPAIRVGLFDSSSTPRELASRRAGSMVTTQAVRPRRAASRAMAAEVVVFPTPPDPQQMTIDRSRTTSPMVAGAGRRSSGPVGRAGRSRGHRIGLVEGLDAPAEGRLRVSSSRGPMASANR